MTAAAGYPHSYDHWSSIIAHTEPALLALVITGYIAGDFIASWWFLAVSTPTSVVVFAALVVLTPHHDYHVLCPRCAASTPLDGQGEAERRRPTLDRFHWLHDHQRGLNRAIFGAVLLAMVLRFVPHTWLASDALMVLVYAAWAYVSWLNITHRPLQPWCPHCHWDDGGDDEVVPEVPTPTGRGAV